MDLWSELRPWERRARLAQVHPDLTEDALIADGRNVAELRPQIDAQKSKDDQVLIVLSYFGDQRHPQPAELAKYGPAINGKAVLLSPRWGRLPPLDDDIAARDKRGAKELGIPERELWWIIEHRLENSDRSRKWLARETKRRADLTYVPRDRLSPLVTWIDLHPDAARRAATLREIPPEFRAGKLGPIPPKG